MSVRRLVAGLVAALLVVAILVFVPLGDEASYPRSNILLVTLDTLRADRVGAYGHAAAETPTLDRLAAEGIRFDQAVSPQPLTLPSHASLMTARYPAAHGIRDNGSLDLSASAFTLAEELRSAGYDTGAFVGAYVLHSRWGLDRGFDTYDDDFDLGSPDTVPGQVERRGDVVVDAALPWLREARERPFFAWVHLYDPHAPYSAPEPWASRHAGRAYDAEVAFTDHQVGRLVEALGADGTLDETLVVVTADHGEGLRDHGEPGHGMFLYDTTVHVPLLVRLPGGGLAGTTVPGQVRLIDVAPTVLDLLDLEAPGGWEGASLVGRLDGGGDDLPAYAETFFPRFHFGWEQLHALRAGGYKYILAPRPELYDVSSDPGETENLVEVEPERAARMRAELEEMLAGMPEAGAGDIPADALAALRSLGYIGTAPADTGDGPMPDPKDKIELFALLTDAQSFLQTGEPARAEAILEEVLADDPGIVDAQLTLGNARFAQGDWAAAATAFQAALELRPDYELALANLGTSHRRMGEPEAAAADFRTLLEIDPTSTAARFHLGEMALDDGRPADALAHFDEGIRVDDAVAALHFGRGVASLQLGDVATAAAALQRAAELAPAYPQVHYYLAQVAERRDDPATAVDHYRDEVSRFPANHRAWFNLSVLLTERGDLFDAVDALRRAVEARPDFAVGHLYLGRGLLALEDPAVLEEAEAAARRGLELGPPPEVLPLGHFVLADVYNRLGRRDDAATQLRLAREAQARIGG